MRETRSLGDLPTVRPSDIQWLAATRPLLALPAGTVAVDSNSTLPCPDALEHWVGFFAAAVALDVSWGVLHGAVRLTTIEVDGHRVEVISAFGRLALLVANERFAEPPRAKELGARVARASTSGERYSLEWAAAAYALLVLEAR